MALIVINTMPQQKVFEGFVYWSRAWCTPSFARSGTRCILFYGFTNYRPERSSKEPGDPLHDQKHDNIKICREAVPEDTDTRIDNSATDLYIRPMTHSN